ncbi:hypothetical protein [Pseudoalteromonas sp. NBT06-2]|uniref:hypothetical protein n=1 Tax=Pseudoalteromonas sp. NBT06-2 TaxID=2025950 RepID=UPI001482FA4E|nr:hypothetical protein [Pseudoalteromonas sp. NBT06-2]
MKYLQVTILIAVIGFSSPTFATGSKRVPPLAIESTEQSLIEIMIDVFTFK